MENMCCVCFKVSDKSLFLLLLIFVGLYCAEFNVLHHTTKCYILYHNVVYFVCESAANVLTSHSATAVRDGHNQLVGSTSDRGCCKIDLSAAAIQLLTGQLKSSKTSNNGAEINADGGPYVSTTGLQQGNQAYERPAIKKL